MPFDFGGLAEALNPLLQAGIGYVTQKQQLKQAQKIAKLQNSSFGGSPFPMLGTGAMAFPGDFSVMPINLGNVPAPVTSGTIGGMLSSAYPREVQYGDRVYVNRGRALLYSGDLAACKRVNKIAARAHRAIGRRRPR